MGNARDELLQRIIDDIARHGFADRSLRELATASGSSHRMLLYHFGSREGLVQAVVDEVESMQRQFLATSPPSSSGEEIIRTLWRRVADPQLRPFVQLFFEAAVYSSRLCDKATVSPPQAGEHESDTPSAARSELTDVWIEQVEQHASERHEPVDPAEIRLGIAVTRGLLVDVMTGGSLSAATDALERFIAMWGDYRDRPQ